MSESGTDRANTARESLATFEAMAAETPPMTAGGTAFSPCVTASRAALPAPKVIRPNNGPGAFRLGRNEK